MKIGADSPWKVGLAVVLLAGALYVFVQLSASAPSPAAARAAARGGNRATTADAENRASRSRRGNRAARIAFPPTLDPTLRLDVLQAVESLEYQGRGRNIFVIGSEPAPRETAAASAPVRPATPPPEVVDPGPPPPPPINLRFYGMASRSGEPKRVFLSNGEDIFMGGEGDIINRRYRIVKIGATTVEIEDVLSNNRQTIPMTQG